MVGVFKELLEELENRVRRVREEALVNWEDLVLMEQREIRVH